MQTNIQKLVEAEILFLKRLIIAFLVFAISFPNLLYAQSTAPVTTTAPVETPKSPFPVVSPNDFQALNSDELSKNANLILDELEFLLADKNPRIVLNAYDKDIINDYYTLSLGEALVKQIGTEDREKIDQFIATSDDLETKKETLSVEKRADTLLVYINSVETQLIHPYVKTNFGLAKNDLEIAKNDKIESQYYAGVELIANLHAIIHDSAELPQAKDLPPLDRRTIEYLLYLVTPTDRGGAGHERIRVQRIWKNYNFEDEKKNISKETEEASNVSAHNAGQACDIDQIDQVRCAIWQYRRLGGVKVKKQKPQPIAVNYQTDQGVASAPPPTGDNFNEFFKNTAYSALIDSLTDEGLLNGEYDDLQGSSFSDLLKMAGEEILMNALLDPKNALSGESITDTIEKVGRIYLADELSLPREALLYGSDVDEIEEISGRYLVEEMIGLEKGSLRHGNTSRELITSTGLRHIETIFELNPGALDAGLGGSENAFTMKIGQERISSELGIASEKLNGNSKSDWEKAIGKTKFDLIFSQPAFVDEMLGLEYGSTTNFKTTGNAQEYKKLVGEIVIEDKLAGYYHYKDSDSEGVTKKETARAEAFGLPNRTFLKTNGGNDIDLFEAILAGDNSAVYPVGAYRVAINSVNDTTKNSGTVFKYLIDSNTKSLDEILKNEINNNTGLNKDQFSDIFKNDASIAVFRYYGNKALINGIKNNPNVEEAEAKMLDDFKEKNPELYGTIEFRVGKIKEAQQVANENSSIARKLDRTITDPEIKRLTNEITTATKNMLPDENNASLNKMISGATDMLKLISQLMVELDKPQNSAVEDDLEHYIENLYTLEKLAHEIISGEPYESTREIDIKDRNANGSTLTNTDVLKLLEILSVKDQTARNEQFTNFILSLGSRQLDNALDLPENSFYYMFAGSSTVTDISDDEIKVCDKNKEAEIAKIVDKYNQLEQDIVNNPDSLSPPLGTDPLLWAQEQLRQLDNQEKAEIEAVKAKSCKSSKATINTSLSSDGFLIAIGQAKFEEYFDKKASSASPKLIIRSSRKDLDEIDHSFHIDNGATAQYLSDEITLENYFKTIGEKTVESQLIGTLADDLSILGIAITSDDIFNILNGDGEYTLARIGGLKLDETLDLPGGTGEKIISAQTNDERALAVAQASGGWLFDKIGFNPLVFVGDISQRYAQDEIERYFKFPTGSFKPTATLKEILPVENIDWFNRETIFPTDFADEFKIDYKNKETGALAYLSDTEYTRALVNKDKEYFDQLETEVQYRILNYSSRTWRSDLNDLTSPASKRAVEIDAHFGDLPKDSTKNFLLQQISPAQYIDLVQEYYLEKQQTDTVVNVAVGELADQVCQKNDTECKAKIKIAYKDVFAVWNKDENKDKNIEDWTVEDRLRFYHGLTAIFDINLNQTAGLPEGTIEEVLKDPANAETTLIYGGLRIVEKQTGLDRKDGKEAGYLTDAYNYYLIKKEDRPETVPSETEQQVCKENEEIHINNWYNEEESKIVPEVESLHLPDVGQERSEIDRRTAELNTERDQKIAQLNSSCSTPKRNHKETLDQKIDGAKDKVKDRAMTELKDELNDFFKNDLDVNLEAEGYNDHLEAIINGDMRYLVYIGVASIASELNSFDKDGQKIDLPPEYQITYEDVWSSENLTKEDETTVVSYGESEQDYVEAMQGPRDTSDPNVVGGAYYEGMAPQEVNHKAQETKRKEILEENKRRFQGKVFTAYAYQLDQHIPPDFGYVMFYGTDKERLDVTFEYGVNYALDATNLDQYGITAKGVEALKNFMLDGSDANWNEVVKSGVYGGIESLINQKDLFGFQLQEGTISQLANGFKTGDYSELLKNYTGWAEGKAFSIADDLFGFKEGTTQQIYEAYKAYDEAYEAYKAAKTADDLNKAHTAMVNAAVILITMIITMAFSDQIASMEESLGLVPGTGAMLVGMAVGLMLGVPIDPITVAIFVLINLIGVYKTEIYCTVDGYYPEPENESWSFNPVSIVAGGILGVSTAINVNADVGYEDNLGSPQGWGSRTYPSQSLNVGSGVFDGMNAKKYREGLKLGAQLKVKDLVGDTLDFPFYFDKNSVHISERQTNPDDYSLPTQVLTFDQKTADTYWNTDIYKKVFKNSNPSENDKRGIGFSPLIPDRVHVGF